MNSLARSLGAYLSSRNNDIAGYWGIGMLCAASKREGKPKFSFKIYAGQLIKIYGCEVSNSRVVTDKLVKFDLDSIEGRLSFFEDADIRTVRKNGLAVSRSQSRKPVERA